MRITGWGISGLTVTRLAGLSGALSAIAFMFAYDAVGGINWIPMQFIHREATYERLHDLDDLGRAAAEYMSDRGAAPASLQQLVEAGYIPGEGWENVSYDRVDHKTARICAALPSGTSLPLLARLSGEGGCELPPTAPESFRTPINGAGRHCFDIDLTRY